MTIEVDLHLHTRASDGTLTPEQLIIDLCAARGLRVVAISDHDSTEGLPAALDAAKRHDGLRVIPAIELSTDVPGSEIHVLGYFIDTSDADFQRTLTQFREGRYERGKGMVRRLNDMGYEITWERVQEISGRRFHRQTAYCERLSGSGLFRVSQSGIRQADRARRPRLRGNAPS